MAARDPVRRGFAHRWRRFGGGGICRLAAGAAHRAPARGAARVPAGRDPGRQARRAGRLAG